MTAASDRAGTGGAAPAETARRAIPAAARESVWAAPDGHRLRRIDWPGEPKGPGETDANADAEAAPRGALLFLAGRGDHYEKYLETLDGWHREGWRVTAIDWRGQAGSGRLGADAITGHIEDFAIWADDLAAFWRAWRDEVPGPRVIVGHSMGGHLALRSIEEGRIDPAAAVLIAPMLGFAGLPLPYGFLRSVARLRCATGDPRRPAWRWSEKPGQFPAGRIALLTHDEARYADEVWWRAARPELAMGPASWRWVEAALVSMARTMRAPALAAVRVPVLILAASADRLVSPRAIRRAAQFLPDATLLEFGSEARHEILRETDPVRDRALAAIRAFLDARVPR